MEIPPPSVPASQLTDWRQTDRTVESPFSTPMVSAYTHTLVYEETTQRQEVFERTGVDHPWQFFFASRIQLKPAQPPNPVLSSLIRQRVDRAFIERLSGRGLENINRAESHTVSLGTANGKRTRYSARLDCTVESHEELLSVPIEAYLVVWADDDYLLAGGAYPAGRAESGPQELIETLADIIDPTAARNELFGLLEGCCGSD